MSRYNICIIIIIMVDVTEKHGNRLALTFISIRVSSLVRFLPRSSGRAVNQTRGPRIYNNIIHASTVPRPVRRILYTVSGDGTKTLQLELPVAAHPLVKQNTYYYVPWNPCDVGVWACDVVHLIIFFRFRLTRRRVNNAYHVSR